MTIHGSWIYNSGTTGSTDKCEKGNKEMKFIAVGDNCVDYYEQDGIQCAGGCSFNVSVYISQLGGTSAYSGAVGDDDAGRFLKETLRQAGVDITHLHTLTGKTAVTKLELRNHERRFLKYEEGVLKDFKPDGEDLAFIQSHDYVHTSVYGGVEHLLPQLAGHVRICYDFANKLTLPGRNAILKLADFSFFSYERDDTYIRDYLEDACRQGTGCGVAMLGAEGSLAFTGTEFIRKPGNRVAVLDTIGAGDSFIAGFLYAHAQGKEVKACLDMGAVKAEETISYRGAIRLN